MNTSQHPKLIQGGMGIAISNWKLAKTVSKLGHLGVVSGTAINSVLIRRLQDGDLSGNTRRAMEAFPIQSISNSILEQYYIKNGKPKDQPYKRSQLYNLKSTIPLLQLTVVASFVEVYLAKENHAGVIGINLLEKVVLPNLACLYGAMLADVNYVIMGAGIPREIPGALDLLSENNEASLRVPVEGSQSDEVFLTTFNPAEILGVKILKKLNRPFFFPIVSSSILAMTLKKKSTGRVDGFIVESPLAGGHNAPPRGPLNLNSLGEPIYGERDKVCLKAMKELDLPFWMAGYYATPERIKEVCNAGAQGIQVGTLFAFCEESGMDSVIKENIISKIKNNQAPKNGWVFTDPVSSPTGFPFKAVRLDNTVSEESVYKNRMRICDLGYLRHAYKTNDNKVAQRCPAEPVADFIKKGGEENQTVGRKCLCNALMADIGMEQKQSDGSFEKPLITAGDDLNNLIKLLNKCTDNTKNNYTADDVISYLEL